MKPEGYSTVSPYLVVDGAQQVIDFLEQVFEASQLRRYDNPDGSIMHVELRIGDSVVMMGDASGDWHSFPSYVHVYVDDVDAVYQRALAAGGQSIQEPVQQQGDPDRRGGVKDPSGNTWWIATQIS